MIDRSALAAWVRAEGLGSEVGEIVPLTGGTQNVVLRVELDGRPVVLRRPPEHPRPTSDRTLTREITVLRGLAGTDVPHPRLVAGCTDTSVLGVVFLLMELVDGVNPGERVSAAQRADPALRHGQGLAMARALARLGAVDPVAQGLDVLHRPGFLERQVPQWLRQLESYREFPRWDPTGLPGVRHVAERLEATRPPSSPPGVMHGDYHLNNVLFAPDRPEVAAIVDWEMSTVGDPLLDLGWLLVSWPAPPRAMVVGEPFARGRGGARPPRGAGRRLRRRGRARPRARRLVHRARRVQARRRAGGDLGAGERGPGPRGGGQAAARERGRPAHRGPADRRRGLVRPGVTRGVSR